MQREKLRGRAGRKAWMFERRLEEGRGSDLAKECRLEMSRRCREGRVTSKWEEERKTFFEDRSMMIQEEKRIWRKGSGLI